MSNSELQKAYDSVVAYGNVTLAAKALGMPRQTLNDQFTAAINRLDLPDPRSKATEFSGFTAFTPRHDKERTLEELLKYRREEAARSIEYDDQVKIININVKADGPIGLMIFGDPHIDSPGCDFPALESHLKIAADRKQYILSGNIGDLRDNWIGRLERLYAETTISARETWKLVEWMMKGCGVSWAWLSKGNHDLWAGINDPLDWMIKPSIGFMQGSGLRIAFKHPNGVETRMHARHDFSGQSIYNPLHALKREILHGSRDHVIVAGHRHIGADAGDVNGDGNAFQMVRVSGYKVVDSYRHENGLKAKPIHPSALVIVDPELPDSERGRAWCAPSCEEGADYLDWKRQRFNSRPRPKKKAAR